MALTNKTLTDIAVKRLSGKAQTSARLAISSELYGSTVQTIASTVFSTGIPNTALTGSMVMSEDTNLFTVQSGSIELVDFELTPIPTSNYVTQVSSDAGSPEDEGDDSPASSSPTAHAWALKVTSSYEANTDNSKSGSGVFSNGFSLTGSIKSQVVPIFASNLPGALNPYVPTLFGQDGEVLSSTDGIDWYLDPYAGILFLQDPNPTLTSKVPLKLRAFYYVGDYLDQSLNIAQSGSTGPQGYQGPAGPQGFEGPSGDDGVQGPTGPQGLVGVQGIQGPAGAQGVQGPSGSQGPQGTVGTQGYQGPSGGTGPQGISGPQGNQGPIGPQGLTGSLGPQGVQGPQGPGVGDTGPQGPQGPTGDQGPGSVAGDQGPQGPIGPQGVQGPQGTGAQGPQGSVGPLGTQGLTGPQGLTGQQGPTGPQGVQGIAGPQGVQGPLGPQGVIGFQGPQGDIGPQGIRGFQGYQGSGTQGPQGSAGSQGVQGPLGPQGATGAQGATGVQGLAGVQGVQGPLGPQGALGNQGPQGLIGAQGVQGPLGPQGAQGAGFQGPQGLIGAQGVQGPQGFGAQGPTGPQGPGGEGGYLHTQTSPTGSWTVGHQLNQGYPSVTVYETGSNAVVIPTSITSIDLNNLQIKFAYPVAGRAMVIAGSGPQGPQGPAGSGTGTGDGAQGPQGPVGPQGLGVQGVQGPAGETGPQGPAGIGSGSLNGTIFSYPASSFTTTGEQGSSNLFHILQSNTVSDVEDQMLMQFIVPGSILSVGDTLKLSTSGFIADIDNPDEPPQLFIRLGRTGIGGFENIASITNIPSGSSGHFLAEVELVGTRSPDGTTDSLPWTSKTISPEGISIDHNIGGTINGNVLSDYNFTFQLIARTRSSDVSIYRCNLVLSPYHTILETWDT